LGTGLVLARKGDLTEAARWMTTLNDQALYYLPEAHTDMMFAVVGEELGLVGVTLVIMAFCAFGYARIRLAIATRDPFAQRTPAGVTPLACGQRAINMAAALPPPPPPPVPPPPPSPPP